MTFWIKLRWGGSAVFILMVLIIGFSAAPSGSHGGGAAQPVRPAPIIVR